MYREMCGISYMMPLPERNIVFPVPKMSHAKPTARREVVPVRVIGPADLLSYLHDLARCRIKICQLLFASVIGRLTS